jgi:hypothetical protein
MQRKILLIITTVWFISFSGFAQQITYADLSKEDNKRINFEIIGNFKGNYLIYKNTNRKHRITVYDKDMHISNNIKLDFISDKTFNVDFINYPDYFYVIYQYQKGKIVYCKAAKLDGNGQLMGDIITLDTTKINFFNENKIYYLTNSEDKQKILLYKLQTHNNDISLTTKLFTASLQVLDSTRHSFPYNERRETYDDLQVANDGTFLFAKEISNRRNDYSKQLFINYCRPNTDSLISKEIILDDYYVEDVKINIDNLNSQYLINSFTYKKNYGDIVGLFSVFIDKNELAITKKTVTIFGDSVREMLSGKGNGRSAFNDFVLRKIILKRDGGFIINAEEYYTQNRGNRLNNRDYYYSPYYYSPNYYSFQRSYYYGYYRDPFANNANDILYNYGDVLIFGFNKDLQPEWTNIINKKQSDLGSDNFLSYSTINMGAELHYLFLQKDNNREVMSDHALQPDGQILRSPTIKSGEAGYDFMPKLAKQVGARQIIVPCILRGTIGFAKIDFF